MGGGGVQNEANYSSCLSSFLEEIFKSLGRFGTEIKIVDGF